MFQDVAQATSWGGKETDIGQRPEILESLRALCWRVSLFDWRRWLVNLWWISFLGNWRFKVTSSKWVCSVNWRCWSYWHERLTHQAWEHRSPSSDCNYFKTKHSSQFDLKIDKESINVKFKARIGWISEYPSHSVSATATDTEKDKVIRIRTVVNAI